MEMTLKDYLAEVDRWKEAADRDLQSLSPAERSAQARKARAWLEAKLGRPLQTVATPQSRPRASS